MDMNEQALRACFDACLLIDEEMAQDPNVWMTWRNPFTNRP
jgi:hypothetical protein